MQTRTAIFTLPMAFLQGKRSVRTKSDSVLLKVFLKKDRKCLVTLINYMHDSRKLDTNYYLAFLPRQQKASIPGRNTDRKP